MICCDCSAAGPKASKWKLTECLHGTAEVSWKNFHRRVVDVQQHSIHLLKSNNFSVSKCYIFFFFYSPSSKRDRFQIYPWLIRLPEWSTDFPWQMKWTEMLMLHNNCTWYSLPFSSGHCLDHIEQQMGLCLSKFLLQWICCSSKSYSVQADLKKNLTIFFSILIGRSS